MLCVDIIFIFSFFPVNFHYAKKVWRTHNGDVPADLNIRLVFLLLFFKFYDGDFII